MSVKRQKQDAADDLASAIQSALRRYHATKDAPGMARQLSMIAKEAEDDGVWRCDHVEQCSHRAMCANKHLLPGKYAVKAAS